MSTESRLTLDSPNIRGYVRKQPPVASQHQIPPSASDGNHAHRPPRSRLIYDRHPSHASRHPLPVHHEKPPVHHETEEVLVPVSRPPAAPPHRYRSAVQELPTVVVTPAELPPMPFDLTTDEEEFPDDLPAYSPSIPGKLVRLAAGKAKKFLSSTNQFLQRDIAVDNDTAGDTHHFSSFPQRIWRERALALKICLIAITISLVSFGAASYRSYYVTNQIISQVQPFIPDPELVGQYNVVNRNDTAVLSASTQKDPAAPSEVPISPADIKDYRVEADLPRVVTIPSIGARTIIKSVSRNDVSVARGPSNVFEVNWFKEGAKPADLTGAMLLSGYYSGPSGEGVFHDLDKVQIGDYIQIESGDGTVYTFRVAESLFYELGDTDMTRAITSADPARLGLNLMTCDGDYDASTRTYEHRLLVRTIKI